MSEKRDNPTWLLLPGEVDQLLLKQIEVAIEA